MNCTKKFLALLMVLAMALGMTAVATARSICSNDNGTIRKRYPGTCALR